MDLVSHALIGKIFQVSSKLANFRAKFIVVLFAVVPDFPVLLVYLLLGREKGRPYWIPHSLDWIGIREAHPIWSAMWEVPHSLLFLILVVCPLVLWRRWPRIAIAAYLSHVLVDLPAHTGEWAVKPFYPFGLRVDGFTDAWAWPLRYLVLSWLLLMVIVLVVAGYRRRKRVGT